MSFFVQDTFTGTVGDDLNVHTGETGATWTDLFGNDGKDLYLLDGAGNLQGLTGGASRYMYSSGVPSAYPYPLGAKLKFSSPSDVQDNTWFILAAYDSNDGNGFGIQVSLEYRDRGAGGKTINANMYAAVSGQGTTSIPRVNNIAPVDTEFDIKFVAAADQLTVDLYVDDTLIASLTRGSGLIPLSPYPTFRLLQTSDNVALMSEFYGGIGVTGPVITSFDADPTLVRAGDPSTLTWTATGATSYSLDQGIGVVNSPHVVNPLVTTTYTLTATDGISDDTADVEVQVVPPGLNDLELLLSGGGLNRDTNRSLGGTASIYRVASQAPEYTVALAGMTVVFMSGMPAGTSNIKYDQALNQLSMKAAGDSQYGRFVVPTLDGQYKLAGDTTGTAIVNLDVSLLPGSTVTAAFTAQQVNNNLLGKLPISESQAGGSEYKCFYLRNGGRGRMTGVKLFLEGQPAVGSVAIGLDPIGVGNGVSTGVSRTTLNKNTAPTGVSFSAPSTLETALSVIGGLPAEQAIAVWVRRTVAANVVANDLAYQSNLRVVCEF